MSNTETSATQPPSTAVDYPVGLIFDATFDAFAVRITTLPNRELSFHIAEGPYAHTETVKVVATAIRPGVFLVSWVEASGATVVHVEDFAQSLLYSHATLPNGTFLRMKAAIRLVRAETHGSKSDVAMFSADEASVQIAHPTKRAEASVPVDYDLLMRANLSRVFGERDAERRMVAIRELYAADAVLNEPHASAAGHRAISEAVTALLAALPQDFVFTAQGPAVGHHGIGRLRWGAGRPGQPAAATGMDIAHFQNGRIHSLFVFLDPADS